MAEAYEELNQLESAAKSLLRFGEITWEENLPLDPLSTQKRIDAISALSRNLLLADTGPTADRARTLRDDLEKQVLEAIEEFEKQGEVVLAQRRLSALQDALGSPSQQDMNELLTDRDSRVLSRWDYHFGETVIRTSS